MRQETLTVVARVGGVPPFVALRRALEVFAVSRSVGAASPATLFGDAKLGIHFARLVLLDEAAHAEHPPYLVLESNFDASKEDVREARLEHLERLCLTAGPELYSVFQYCVGFEQPLEPVSFASTLAGLQVEASACYQGHAHRDLQRIYLERHLREVLLDFFARAPKASPRELYRDAREYVRLRSQSDPALHGLNVDGPAPPLPSARMRSERLSAGLGAWFKNVSVSLLAYAVRQLPAIAAWQKKDLEFDDRSEQERWTDAERRTFIDIARTEDHGLQNALTHLVPLKGADRLAVLLAAHGYIDSMAKNHFNDIGQLGGIPTIHFAKWLLIDDRRRLLFLSNYDSGWESYLGDFVDRAAVGLNLAWTCTERYPRTWFLALRGASDEERFKAWSRAHQRPTQVFYSAYPDLGIAALNNNTWIRFGLHDPPCALDLASWFRRLT